MLKYALLATILLIASLSSISYASERYSKDKVVIIDVGSESKSSRRDLEKRLYRLEQAVRQLQDRVFELEIENSYIDLKDNASKLD